MTDLVPTDQPALTGTFIAASALRDSWPAPTALDPKIALLRAAAEAAPVRLFELAPARAAGPGAEHPALVCERLAGVRALLPPSGLQPPARLPAGA